MVEGVLAAVAEAKAAADDPFARVTVAAPTAASVVSLRRAVAGAGAVNVEVAPLARVADGVVGVGGARKPMMGRAVRRRLVASVAPALGGGAASHPATVDALDRVFRELRSCSPEARAAVRASGARGRLLLELFDEFRTLGGAWWDDGDLFEAAAGVGARGAGAVVLYEPGRLSWPEAQFLAALGGAVRVVRSPSPSGAGAELPAATQAVVAPDVEAEVRVAVAAVVDTAVREGVPFSRIAVVHPGGEPYARLAGELLDAAGVPWGGPPTATVGESVAGRTLSSALSLPGAGWSRTAVTHLLASGPIVADGIRAGWEAAARDANVVAGLESWAVRLGRLHGRPAAAALAAWIDQLAQVVEPPSRATTWAAFATWAASVVDGLLPHGAPDGSSPLVAEALSALAGLDGTGRAPDVATFLGAVVAQLATPMPWRPVRNAVLVAPLADAIGVDVDAVVVLGVQEGRLPARRRDDPLLPDAVRAAAAGELATRHSRRDDERRALALVLGSARRVRVVTAARADQRAQQARRPSRWLEEAARSCGVETIASFAALVESPTWSKASAQETAVRAMQFGVADASSFGVERGFAAAAARLGSASTEWDGAVGSHPALVLGERPLSPTSVESWASCPFRYFLRSVLRVRETVVPEQRVSIDARDRGTLVHDVLERVVGARMDGGGDPVDAVAIADEVCRTYEVEGRVGRALPWLLERRTIDAHLQAVLARDGLDDPTLQPARAEVAFGLADAELPAVEVPLGDGSGRAARFGGRIDRVDATVDGSRARVTDYKTGRSDAYRELSSTTDATLAGTRLQLPIYALAARHLFPDADVSAGYWFVTDAPKGYPRVDVALDDSTFERLREVVTHVVGAIEDGVFPPQPGEAVLDSFKECRYCEFDRVCSADRGDAAERKRDDQATVRFLGLRPAS